MFVNEFQSESKYTGSTTSSNEITEEAEAQQNVADLKVEEQFESILKTKPRGKTKMQVDKYEVKCQKQLEQLNQKMKAIDNKKDREWLKLRKRKIACEARLRGRQSEAIRVKQLPMLDLMLQKALALTQELIGPDQLIDFKADLKKRGIDLMS